MTAGKPRARIASEEEIAADRAAALRHADAGTRSGRSEPHPSAAPAHALRWRAAIDQTARDSRDWKPVLAVECECGQLWTLRDTYTTGQLVRLDAMHCGVTP